MKPPQIRTVVIVEDDEQTRARFIDKIATCPNLAVVGEAASCAEALARLAEVQPDVLLVDLGLPDGDGADIIQYATRLSRVPAIMVTTVFGDEQRVLRAIRSGASGYLLKTDPAHDICASIEELLAGGAPISPVIARYLIRHFREDSAQEGVDTESAGLTERELEVLRLAAKGYTYQEVADLLGLSVNTVGTHTRIVYRKLAVGSRSEAVFEAARLGLV
ncbi:MAG: response regulator transcription factor, partial [Pseudomonadales bacterium]|nr:response regulator transcription factor [Pseudomonadales bacterium]